MADGPGRVIVTSLSNVNRRDLIRVGPVVVALLAAGGCADSSPSTLSARPIDDSRAADTTIGAGRSGTDDGDSAPEGAAAADARWGHGRALAAATAEDGTTAIVTTAEVHLWLPGESTTVALDETVVERRDLVAITDDASTVATVEADPAMIRWYDTATGDVVAVASLPDGAAPEAIHFLPGTAGLLAETDLGPLAWMAPPTGDEPPVRPTDGSIAGRSALRPSGIAVTPLIGTTSVAVLRDGVSVSVPLDVAAGSVQRVTASPDGSLLVAEVAVGATEFDRLDRLVVLDPRQYTTLATIELGRDVASDGWAAGNDAIAVALGDRVALFDGSGTAIGDLRSDHASSIGRVVAVAGGFMGFGNDGAVTFWDVAGAPTTVVEAGRLIGRETVGPGAEHLTSVDTLGRVTTLSGRDGSTTRSLDDFAIGELTAVSVADDGTIAAATTVGRVVLVDDDLRPLADLSATDEAVRVDSVAFRPGGGELAAGRAERRGDLAFDDTLTLWDVDAGEPRIQTGGESEDVPGCAFFFHRLAYTSDGRLLATASHDRTVGVLDAATGSELIRLPARSGSILDLAFTPDDDRLVISADDNTIEIWSVDDWSVVGTIDSLAGGYSALAPIPGRDAIVVADVTGGLHVVDLATGSVALTFDALLPPRPTSVTIDPTGTRVASPLSDDDFGVWDIETGAPIGTYAGHTDDVTDVAFTAGGDGIVSVAADGTVRAWALDRA